MAAAGWPPGRPPFPTAPGDGAAEFTLVRGKTTLSTLRSTYPLKMLNLHGAARKCGGGDQGAKDGGELPGAEWVYMLGHGGGIVSGDVMRVKVCVGEGCTAVMTTQSFTKVFTQHNGQIARQLMRARVGAGALLAVLPDPIVPFRDSRFAQHQEFDLAPSGTVHGGEGESVANGVGVPGDGGEGVEGGSLVLIDWMTSGRQARGEEWDMEHYQSVNRVLMSSRCILHDALKLEREPLNASVQERMHPFHCLAMVALIGPRTRKLAQHVRELIQKRQAERIVDKDGNAAPSVGNKRPRHPGEEEEEPWDGLICSVSDLPEGNGVVLRVAGHEHSSVESFLRMHLKGASTYSSLSPPPSPFPPPPHLSLSQGAADC